MPGNISTPLTCSRSRSQRRPPTACVAVLSGIQGRSHIRTLTRTHMKNAFLLFGLLSASIACFSAGEAADTAPPHLDCFLGPTTKVFGKSNSLTYSCSDGKSLALASAPGNPAFPFAFLLHEKGDVYRVYGEGGQQGSKPFRVGRTVAAHGGRARDDCQRDDPKRFTSQVKKVNGRRFHA